MSTKCLKVGHKIITKKSSEIPFQPLPLPPQLVLLKIRHWRK